ncbi:hypothetical protein X735_22505 [Mesorhizobium sp. L2C085B000]|nr:hypothetical protein X735_22505 [Mesorhizobium sp. L2C085B000]
MPASGAGLRVERGGSDQSADEDHVAPCERATPLCAGGIRGGEMAKTISPPLQPSVLTVDVPYASVLADVESAQHPGWLIQ